MFAAWAVMVWLTWERSDRRTVRVVVGLAAAATMIGVLALPNQTSDVYDYAAFGRVVTHHDGVPYEDLPSAHPDDPLVQLASPRYTTQPDNKLPVVDRGRHRHQRSWPGDSPLSSLLAFRILLGACTVATTVLIAWILSRIRPGCRGQRCRRVRAQPDHDRLRHLEVRRPHGAAAGRGDRARRRGPAAVGHDRRRRARCW